MYLQVVFRTRLRQKLEHFLANSSDEEVCFGKMYLRMFSEGSGVESVVFDVLLESDGTFMS